MSLNLLNIKKLTIAIYVTKIKHGKGFSQF